MAFLTTAISSQALHDFLARAVIRIHRLKLEKKPVKGFATQLQESATFLHPHALPIELRFTHVHS